jgi:hypothetical protein
MQVKKPKVVQTSLAEKHKPVRAALWSPLADMATSFFEFKVVIL